MIILFSYFKELKKVHFLAVLLLITSIPSFGVFIIGVVIDKVIYDDVIAFNDSNLIILCIFGLLAGIFLKIVINYFISNAKNKFYNQSVAFIRSRLLKKVLNSKASSFYNFSSGDIVKYLVDDVDTVTAGLSAGLEIFMEIMLFLSISIVAIMVDFKFLALVVFVVIVFYIWIHLWSKPLIVSMEKINENYNDLYNMYWEAIPGIKEVKLFNLNNVVRKKLAKSQNQILVNTKKESLIVSFSNVLADILPYIIYITIVVYGIKKIHSGELTIGYFFSLIAIFYMLFNPIFEIIEKNGALKMGVEAANRLIPIENISCETSGSIEVTKNIDKIEFKKVSFSYQDKNILNEVDLKFEKGHIYSVVGQSGSGKSTIMKLINGLYDANKGSILINGTSIEDFSKSSVRRNIIHVTQECHFFRGTLKENIDVYNMLETEDIKKILCDLNLDNFATDEKLNQKIGESGLDFSGGEKQRLSLARAIAADANVYCFDEVSSALDPKNEKEILNSILSRLKNKILIFITHNSYILSQSTHVTVIKDGCVSISGEYEEVKNSSNFITAFDE